MELVNHYANRTLIVSCTRNCTWVWGEGLRAVGGPWAPGSLLATDRSRTVVFGVVPTKCFWSRCFVS